MDIVKFSDFVKTLPKLFVAFEDSIEKYSKQSYDSVIKQINQYLEKNNYISKKSLFYNLENHNIYKISRCSNLVYSACNTDLIILFLIELVPVTSNSEYIDHLYLQTIRHNLFNFNIRNVKYVDNFIIRHKHNYDHRYYYIKDCDLDENGIKDLFSI